MTSTSISERHRLGAGKSWFKMTSRGGKRFVKGIRTLYTNLFTFDDHGRVILRFGITKKEALAAIGNGHLQKRYALKAANLSKKKILLRKMVLREGATLKKLSRASSCKFSTRTHTGRACFSIPKWVQDDLSLRKFGNKVKLIIDSRTGHFEGTKRMMSGAEIYGKDLHEKGINRDQPITVVASCPHQGRGKESQNLYLLPSESELVSPAGLVSIEGGHALVQVNRFERDPRARKHCIRIFGTRCAVCGFDFVETYGKIGAGFIHVHHLRPLSMGRKKHKVDVRRDLRPVCPNCHEMLHRKKPPFSIEAMKARISKL